MNESKSSSAVAGTKSNKTNILLIVLAVVGLLLVARFALQPNTSTTDQTTETEQMASTSSLIGAFRTTLPSASGPARIVTMETTADGVVALTQDYQNDEPPFINTGTWVQEGEDTLLATFDQRSGEAMEEPMTLSFTYSDINAGILTLNDPEANGFGAEGLVLQNIDPFAGRTWVWTKTTMHDGAITEADTAQSFSLTFAADGSVSMTTDCNSGGGNYALFREAGIQIGPMATTMMFCEGSGEGEFNRQISLVDSYVLIDDNLYLLLPVDSGSMEFISAIPSR